MPNYPTPTGPIQSPGLLWCEGPDDFAFFRRVLGYLGIAETVVRAEVFEGKDMLARYLTTLLLRPGFLNLRSLGIVRDADEDAAGALASVKAHLTRNGFLVPDNHGEFRTGHVSDGQEISVGVYVAPDGVSAGALESLLLRAVPASPIAACVQAFMKCVMPEVVQTRVAQLAKIEFHTWLAACPQPGIQSGRALQEDYIDRNSPAFDQIKQFLRDLAVAAVLPDAQLQ